MLKKLFTKMQRQIVSFRTVLILLWGASPQAIILLILASSLTGFLTPIGLLCTQHFLDAIVRSVSAGGKFASVVIWLLLLLGVTLFGNLTSMALQTLRANFSDVLALHITQKTLAKYQVIHAEAFEKKEIYDRIHMAVTETPNRCALYIDMICGVTKAVVSLTGVIAILASFDVRIVFATCCLTIPLLKIKNKISIKKYGIYRQQAESHRLCNSLFAILLNAPNIPELKVMNGGNYIANEIGTTIQQQNGDNRAIRARTLKADTAAIGISNAITFGVKIWIVVSAISQELTVGSIYQMLSAFDSMQTLLQSLVYQISSGYEQSLYVSNLLVLWGLSEESTKMQVELTAPIQKIEFCDVSFSYPGSARPALKNVNLTLTTGSLYTIIGENGSGKSTLIKLMLGLYTPTQGEIMVNEKPISTWSPSSLRKQMSAVFQNQIHYPFDVKTNIGVVEPFRMTNRNDVHSAAERAQADSFIQQLPHGYETQLCKEWKDGFELSGGQWQRIALARFLFPDASLCILDEPFSALDTVAEEHILKEILANQSNKITVLITHRYDDLTDQENIIVMEDTPQFFVMFWNSIGQSVAQVAGNLLVGAPAAWAISRLRFRGRSMVRGLYIVLMLLPFQVTMVPSYLVLRQFGLLDTPWAIILPGIFSTFPVFIMERGFDTVPREVLESASIDGANQWQRFWRIGIPLGIPGLISALTLGFLDAWNAIEQPMTFLESPQYWPLSLFFTDPANLDTKQLGLAMAASLWMLLPSILAFRFGQTYLEAGLTKGAVKG